MMWLFFDGSTYHRRVFRITIILVCTRVPCPRLQQSFLVVDASVVLPPLRACGHRSTAICPRGISSSCISSRAKTRWGASPLIKASRNLYVCWRSRLCQFCSAALVSVGFARCLATKAREIVAAAANKDPTFDSARCDRT